VILPALMTKLQTSATGWVTPFTSETVEYIPCTYGKAGLVSDLLTSHPDPILGSMRSRKQGIGI